MEKFLLYLLLEFDFSFKMIKILFFLGGYFTIRQLRISTPLLFIITTAELNTETLKLFSSFRGHFLRKYTPFYTL